MSVSGRGSVFQHERGAQRVERRRGAVRGAKAVCDEFRRELSGAPPRGAEVFVELDARLGELFDEGERYLSVRRRYVAEAHRGERIVYLRRVQPHEAVVEEYPVVRDVAVERSFAEAAAFVDVHLEPFGADEIHQLARDFDAFDRRRDGERDEAAPLTRGRHACEHAAAAVRRRAGLDEADDAFFLFRRQLRPGAELHNGDVYSASAHERRVACDYFVRRDEVFESARDVAAGAYPSVSVGDVGKDGMRQ